MKIQKFQVSSPKFFSGIDKANIYHTTGMFKKNEQLIGKLTYMLAAQQGPIPGHWLDSCPTIEVDRDDAYTWDIAGNTRRNIPLVEARDETGALVDEGKLTTMIGKNTSPFQLVFGEEWFFDGEVLHGHLEELYEMRILGPAKREGVNFVYDVELMGGNMLGIPGERLQKGELFSAEYNPVEAEFSRGVGGLRGSTTMTLRNEFSHLRLKHKAGGSFSQNNNAYVYKVPVQTQNGLIECTGWEQEVSLKLNYEFYRQKGSARLKARSNQNKNGEFTNIGKSGMSIRMGAGFNEQAEYGKVIYYNKFDLSQLEDILLTLCTQACIKKENRIFHMQTGAWGNRQFSQAAAQMLNRWQWSNSVNEPARMEKNSEQKRGITAGNYNINRWIFSNDIELYVTVDPSYDDPYSHKMVHPDGGSLWSYVYRIFYAGTKNEPNIYNVKVRGGEDVRAFVKGIRDPFAKALGKSESAINYSGTAATDEDASEVHMFSTFGVAVVDPTRVISLYPVGLRG